MFPVVLDSPDDHAGHAVWSVWMWRCGHGSEHVLSVVGCAPSAGRQVVVECVVLLSGPQVALVCQQSFPLLLDLPQPSARFSLWLRPAFRWKGFSLSRWFCFFNYRILHFYNINYHLNHLLMSYTITRFNMSHEKIKYILYVSFLEKKLRRNRFT